MKKPRVQPGHQSEIGFDKTKLECFNCTEYGHFSGECSSPRRSIQIYIHEKDRITCHNTFKVHQCTKAINAGMWNNPKSCQLSSSASALLVIRKDGECDWILYEQEVKQINHDLMVQVSEDI